MSEERATDMNARLRLRSTTTPADLIARLFGTPEAAPEGDDDGGAAA
ncbi:hypothetical protein [Nocardioides sp.]|nr:hypothetical protein [Nocardioides sp.]HXH79112.1 hypothetical protein [Nocardioides sp.]